MFFRLPPFVKLPGEIVPQGGFRTRNAKLYGFAFNGKKENLQKICDDWFNKPAGGKFYFTPLSSVVFMIYIDAGCPMGICQNQEWEKGKCRDRTCAVTQILGQENKVMGVLKFHELKFSFPVKADNGKVYLFVPYYYIDNGNMLSYGREIFGLPGAIASFVSPEDSNREKEDPSGSAGRVSCCEEMISCTVVVPYADLLKIRVDGPGPMHRKIFTLQKITTPGIAEPHPRRENNATTLVARLASGSFPEMAPLDLKHLSDHLSFQGAAVSLRQFRDNVDANKALYQALIEYKIPLAQTSNAVELTSRFNLDFTTLSELSYRQNYPIYEDLGLHEKNNPALFAFKSDVNFEYKPGAVLHLLQNSI